MRDETKLQRAVRVECTRREMTQQDLAQALGYAPTTFSPWLRGVRKGPADLIEQIERVLKLPPGTLPAQEHASKAFADVHGPPCWRCKSAMWDYAIEKNAVATCVHCGVVEGPINFRSLPNGWLPPPTTAKACAKMHAEFLK